MFDSTGSRIERPHTYLVQDRAQEEIARLELQDKMMTTGMGGVLPELADPSLLRQVLDVGCGTGCWLMETARTYPTIGKLVGVDISSKVVRYARTQAEMQHLDRRVQFHAMDALQALDFPAASFDLVNQRVGISWLRTWDWPKVLKEYLRVSRLGGIIRITEGCLVPECNSPALTKLLGILLETFYRSGRLFTQSGDGVMGELVRLMMQHGIENVECRVHTLVFRVGTEIGQAFYEDMLHLFRVALPFFQKWVRVPDSYHEVYQQALEEMQHPEFVATSTLLTAWGTKGGK
jgi:ubiquinone/menaquinone biosynthesis C-methylase UbiE